MHTAPLALTLSLMMFWLALGWAVQAVVRPQIASLASLLLSPLIGFAATLVPVFWLSLAGLPVGRFAWPLTLALALFAAAGWAARRPDWTRRHLLAFGVVVVGVLASGIPSLVFGFDWVANANDDWGNYNLGAMRFIESGMLHRPDIATLDAGKDYPGFFYYLSVARDGRSGSELMLAWLAVLTRQNPFLIFMPLILAFEAIMISAAAALALRGARSPLHWFLGLLLTALAPLGLYAVQQQLIAQNLGIAFTCAMAALTCTRLSELAGWRRLALVVLIAAGYLLSYPEMMPFCGLAFAVFQLAHVRDRGWGWGRAWRLLVVPAGLALVTGPYLLSASLFLLHQFAASGTQGRFGGISIFPYFLVPSGAAMLWGFLPFGQFVPEPWLSTAIVVALSLTAVTLAAALVGLRRGNLTAGILVIFSLVAVQLAHKHNDFGLFKVALFVQPFLWFTLFAAVPGRRVLPALMAGVLGAAVVYTDVKMTATSIRDEAGGGIGVAGASRTHLLHEILDKDGGAWCDAAFETANLPLIKILAARPGCQRLFPARFAASFVVFEGDDWLGVNPLHRVAGIDDFVRLSGKTLRPNFSTLSFKRPDGSALRVDYFNMASVATANVGLITNDESVLNHPHPEFLPVHSRASDAEHLEFIQSSLGDHYYVPYFGPTGMYATEPDPYRKGQLIEAVGRYMLFRVIEPSPEVRIGLDISTTVISGGPRPLPPAVVMGETTVSFDLVGNGSARVLSPPVKPLMVGKDAYVLIDLGKDAKQLETPRTGAMSLYGSEYSVDYRVVSAFARRISVVDAQHCDCAEAPSAIDPVEATLENPTLRYSGIYEDGWIGQDGFARLSSDDPGKVELAGVMPSGIGIQGQNTVTLSVDGGPGVTRRVVPGNFKVALPVGAGPHRIAWHFASAGLLPGGDARGVAAKMLSLAIAPAEDEAAPSSTADVDAIVGDPSRAYAGIDGDGWIEANGFVDVSAERAGTVGLRVMVPGGVGIADNKVTVSVDDGKGATTPVPLGESTVEVPVTPGPHKVAWRFSKTGVLPNGDGRTVAALLKSVAVTYGAD